MVQITPGDLSDPRVISLVQIHLTTAHAATGLGSGHALDLAGLQSPDIRVWALWDSEALLGIGALKRLSLDHAEVKSMHTVRSARRQGVGTAVLRHLIATAQADGLSRLSLETGSPAYFEPVRELYRRHGFEECPPFGD